MKVVVLDAKHMKGVGKNSKQEYDSIVVNVVVYNAREKNYEIKNLWIKTELLYGEIPPFGSVMNIEFEFGSKYIQSVEIVKDTALLSQFVASLQTVIQSAKNA